jgi:hypothetical protein
MTEPRGLSLFRRWQEEIGEAYVVSLVRMILGVLLLVNAARELSELMTSSFFGDVFHLPIVPEALVPSKRVFAALVLAQLLLSILIILGRAARGALVASAAIGIYFLLCDRLGYHNNRYALFLFALLVAFAPCEQAFVVGRPKSAAPSAGPLWAQRLAQLQLALIYLASGSSKLFDPDWRGGLVVGDRLLRSTQIAVEKGVPLELMRWLSDASVASALSKVAIASELFLAIGLFVPRTRFFALWWGTMFHLTIELTSQVELFGWLTLTVYALFAVPKTRERVLLYDPARAAGRWVFQLLRRLDWLARFEFHGEPERLSGRAFAVIDRGGTATHGLSALAHIARATPLLFPLSLPLLAVGHLISRGEVTRVASRPERSGSEDRAE